MVARSSSIIINSTNPSRPLRVQQQYYSSSGFSGIYGGP